MKKTLSLVAAASLAGAMGAYAQGTVSFVDDTINGTTAVEIYAPQTATPSVETTGNSAADTPAGTIVYTGVPIGGSATGSGPTGYANGANYTAELYALGATAQPPTLPAFSALSPVTQYKSTFYTVSVAAGLFQPSFPSSDPGILGTGATTAGGASMSVAAWYSGGGVSSVAAAQAAGVPYGWSPVWWQSALGGSGSPPATPPALAAGPGGLQSFSLVTTSSVPEPCSIVLGLLGAAGCFLARRRK